LRSGTTTRHAATAAKQRFDDDGIPVLGTILNDWNPAHGQMSYREYAKYYDSPDVDSEKS